ncbi:MAG: hypothetical protein ACRC3A_04470, partial [Culicoidibacterales bacterium]
MKKSKKIASATLAACLAWQGTSVQALTTEVTPQLETEEIVPEVVAPTEGTVEQAEEVTPQSEPE